jgi:hypothetical protein
MADISDILGPRFKNIFSLSPAPINIASTFEPTLSTVEKVGTKNNKPAIKRNVKPTNNISKELLETITPTNEFDVAKDSYRHQEVSLNNFTRAAIESNEEKIVEIKIKRVPRPDDISKSVQDNLFNPGGVGGYAHFFIQAIQTPKQERVQILETFTTSWIYLFGQMTPIYTFSGILLNYQGNQTYSDDSHNWAADFMKVYDEQLRGTKTVENGGILEMVFDNILVQGYMLNSNLMRNAATPYGVPFSFSLAIVKEEYMGFGVFFSNQFDTKLTNEVALNAAKPRSPGTITSDLGASINNALQKKVGFNHISFTG